MAVTEGGLLRGQIWSGRTEGGLLRGQGEEGREGDGKRLGFVVQFVGRNWVYFGVIWVGGQRPLSDLMFIDFW